MTYCLGIMTREGLVMASDSRTNAGYDQVNVCRKMHTFVLPGERRVCARVCAAAQGIPDRRCVGEAG